jgi:hypothetical protein
MGSLAEDWKVSPFLALNDYRVLAPFGFVIGLQTGTEPMSFHSHNWISVWVERFTPVKDLHTDEILFQRVSPSFEGISDYKAQE